MSDRFRAARAAKWTALALLFFEPGWGQPVRPSPEAFGALPALVQPSLSPDGKHLATIKPFQGRPVGVIYDLSPHGNPPAAVSTDSSFIVGVQWANNERLLVTINDNHSLPGQGMISWFRTVSVDAKGQNYAFLFKNNRDSNYNTSTSELVDLDLDDPDHVFMALYQNDALTLTAPNDVRKFLYKIDVNSGNAYNVLRGGSKTNQFFMDGHGVVAARIDRTEKPLIDHVFLNINDDWKEVAQFDAEGGHGSGIIGLSDDGKSLVRIALNAQTGTEGLVTLPLSTGEDAKVLFSDQQYDIEGTLTDPWTRRVIGATEITDMSRDRYFDPAMQSLQKGLEAAFPGNSVHAVDWDLSKREVIVAVDGPQMPRSYYFLDRTTHQASFIASTYPGLNKDQLGETKPFPYNARDGVNIPAYLTLPPGKAPKMLPVVILPHGGPRARDEMAFDWQAQFLANRGYAVLQPNFRGSSGYGRKFEEAGYGQWGLKMQDDVTDGVRKLIADGIADPKRICIVGGSYGGYAALAGAAFTPDLYACAVSWAGVSDLNKLLSEEKRYSGGDEWLMSAWHRFIGDGKDSKKLEAVSPAYHADNIKAPILLMHGDADTTVRIEQSEIMEEALKRAGKKVTFIPIAKETHYMQSAETRIRYLTELEKFLAANIGN